MASWPPALREMLYLQLPEEGAKNAGERRPIALLPQVYRLWSACCRADVLEWRQLCKDRGARTKCYERVPLGMLEQFAKESGYPLYTLNVALNMYRGQRRILVQGAWLTVSTGSLLILVGVRVSSVSLGMKLTTRSSGILRCLCKEVADSRPDFQRLASGLATQTLRQLKLPLMLLLEGYGMKLVPTPSMMLATCVLAVERLTPAWAAEWREVALPASALEAPPCVKLHGLLPAPEKQ
eukprot:5859002-Amphidinium_carterae.1